MKLVLLDRDGVINQERRDYVKSIDELVIFPRAFEALELLNRNGFTCVVITNQSVVGRGIMAQNTLERIHHYLCEKIAERGGKIDHIFFCTDTPENATYRRKPKPGMVIEALEKYAAKAAETPFIGDNITDMQAAHAAGCPRYMVMSGVSHNRASAIPNELQPVTICEDILDAVQHIVTL